MKKPGFKYLLMVIVFLLTIGYFVTSSIRHSRLTDETAQRVKLVLDRMIVYENIYDDMQDFETGYRGYVITRDSDYLEPIDRHTREIPLDITKLRSLTNQEGISAAEASDIHNLDSLVQKKIEHGKVVIQLVHDGKQDEAFQRVSSGYGKDLMEKIRTVISSLESSGRYQLQVANTRSSEAAARTRNDYLLSGVIGFSLIGLLLYFLYLEEKRRIRLGREAAHFAAMVDQSQEAIFSVGTDSRILSWNKGAEMMYRIPEQDAVNKRFLDVVRPVMSQEELLAISQHLKTSSHWEGEQIHLRQDGIPIRVISSTNVLLDDEGIKVGYVAHTKDITRIKELEEELQQINSNLAGQVAEKTREIREIFERVTDGFLAVDSKWNITFISDNGAVLLKLEKASALQRNFWDLIPMKYSGEFVQGCEEALLRQRPVELEAYYDPAGSWFQYRIHPSANGLSVFFRDVTVEKRVKEELHRSEQRFRVLVENSRNLIAQFNEHQQLTYINPAGAFILGIPSPEKPQIPFIIQQQLDAVIRKVLQDGAPNEQLVSWKKEEHSCHLLVRVAMVQPDEQGSKMAILVGQDITQEIEHANQLRASRDELRKLTNYLEQVREEERTRIARDIHDQLGQQLTGLKLDLNWIRKKMNGTDPVLNDKILEINRHLDDTVRTVRNISAELRPLLLDDLGLIPAIEHYCEEFHTRTGIQATFSFEGPFPALTDAVNSNLFRILQESLTNVIRHSNARSVIIQLTSSEANLFLTIRDDGDGFETDRKSETLGLIGMKERAIALGGHLVIRSSPGKGTVIEVDVPLSTPLVA